MNKSIDEIVNTFITDLKKTREYKEAWRNCNETKDIVFNFRDKQFYIIQEEDYYGQSLSEICMDEEILLGR
jgi:hypothetical protein